MSYIGTLCALWGRVLKLHGLFLSGALALMVSTPSAPVFAASGATPPRPPVAQSAGSKPTSGGKPIGITVPVGPKSVRLEYKGPIAPWKVLNPFHKGERQSSVSLLGRKSDTGARSEHSVTFSGGRRDSGVGGGVSLASRHGDVSGTPNTRKLSLSAAVGKHGDTLTHEHGVDFASTRVASNGSITTRDLSRNVHVERTGGNVNRVKTLRAETSHVDGETGSSRTLRYEGKKATQPGAKTRTREGSLNHYDAKSETLVARSITQESSASGSGASRKGARGLTVSETTTGADGTSRQLAAGLTQHHEGGPSTLTLRAGRVRQDGAKTTQADGVIVKRTPDGDVSTKVVHAGPRRTRSIGGGESRSLASRVKNAVVGEKTPADASFRNGLPVD